MRIAGLDVGTKTVGVAISDAMGWTAQGIETIPVDTENRHLGFKRISALIEEYEISLFVVGLPKNMNGTIGPRGEACQQYARLLEQKFNIPVKMVDERLTTMQAERILLEADVSRKKRKDVIDKMAATLILQTYLDSNSKK
ncbi:MAG: Holliday junction resolvase-like protein [Bacillales bacterium]|jgi:putative Holliday junction resolvase|nr:Holliday junction resolvase-like protein [Bacillales bacterium]